MHTDCRSRFALSLAALTLAVALTLFAPVLHAEVVNYGTGIHHWVLACGPYADGHSTDTYVGASSCPPYVTLPPECVCELTPYDFPVNNPYPYMRVQTGVPLDGNGNPSTSGVLNVIVDTSQAIECGTLVTPPANNDGVCGAPYTTIPTTQSQVDPTAVQTVSSLIPSIEQQTGVRILTINWLSTQPPQ
jgi:hypothetical protein